MSAGAIAAVFIRPWLWPTALGATFALAPRRWWTRRPFLPVPDGDVVGWRKATAYGSSAAGIAPDDILSYLQWRRSHRTRWRPGNRMSDWLISRGQKRKTENGRRRTPI